MPGEVQSLVETLAKLVDIGAPAPVDLRPMIDSIRRMFQELARAAGEFAELPGNEANLGLAAMGRVFRDLDDLSGRWRAGFAPRAQRSRPPSAVVPDTRLEDCAQSLAAAAAAVGAADRDSEAWIGLVRQFHDSAEDPLVELVRGTAPHLEQELLIALEDLRLAVGEAQ